LLASLLIQGKMPNTFSNVLNLLTTASLKMYDKRLWQRMIVRANLCLQMAVLFVWVLLCEVALLIFYISRNLGRYALGFLIKLKRSLLDRLIRWLRGNTSSLSLRLKGELATSTTYAKRPRKPVQRI